MAIIELDFDIMGRLRICCLLLILATALVALQVKASGAPEIIWVALFIGVAFLLIVTPFPAYDVASRSRVLWACVGYVVASALAVVLAITSQQSALSTASAILPLAGSILTLWAFRTRKRRRVSVFAKYFQE